MTQESPPRTDARDFMTWMVVGPEVRSGGWDEPPEYGHDVVVVAAETRREARVEGVKAFRRIGAGYLDDGENPFRGLEITEAVCRHGVHSRPWNGRGEEDHPCPACEYEWDAYDRARTHAWDDGLDEV